MTPMVGRHTSPQRRTLIPVFVKALMGGPTGRASLASVATEWSLWLQIESARSFALRRSFDATRIRMHHPEK